jgi:hypothetical protein
LARLIRFSQVNTAVVFAAALACSCLFASVGCDSDMSPSRIDVGGAWTGTWRFVTGGVTVTDAVTATLTQNGTNVTGTWTAASGPAGELSFAIGAEIAGTLTMTLTTITGQPCTGTTTLSGTATPTALDFTTTSPAPSGVCQWATSNEFSFRR